MASRASLVSPDGSTVFVADAHRGKIQFRSTEIRVVKLVD